MHTALFSQQHEETMKDRTGLMGKRDRDKEKGWIGDKNEGERERRHSQIIGYNGEGCDEWTKMNLPRKKQMESQREKRNYCGFCKAVISGHLSIVALIPGQVMAESVFTRINHRYTSMLLYYL